MTWKTPAPLYNTTSNFGCRQRPRTSKCEAWILSYSINLLVTSCHRTADTCMYTMLNDGNSDNSSLQLCKTKGQYLLTCRASRCVFSFSTAEWMSSRLSRFGANGQTFLGLHMLHIHTDFEIFRQQIYFILIYLLQRPYFNIVVLKKEHSKM